MSEAREQGDGAWMRFEVGAVNLELQLVVTKNARGQIGWKVLEVGGAVDSERTQKVSLTLTPQWWDATSKVYTTDFLVSGTPPRPRPRINTANPRTCRKRTLIQRRKNRP